VKGIDEVREEIEEVIKMLKHPELYYDAGAKLLKGILLIGKPGTGKTLLARALAGESGVNFIYCNASEFDKALVGKGSMMVKELFKMARRNRPCIIFIDEIDTLLHKGRRSG
jgi:ATP-dependent Zn protease